MNIAIFTDFGKLNYNKNRFSFKVRNNIEFPFNYGNSIFI